MTQSIIQSAQILEAMDPIIELFNLFLHNEYDMAQFRFFTLAIDYSLGFVSPPVSDLMKEETLTPSDTNLTIPVPKAIAVYRSIFPFDSGQPAFDTGQPTVGYWTLMHVCIKKFDASRHHLWNVVKAACFLGDCSDLSHVTQQQFTNFVGLTLPMVTLAQNKQLWFELSTRNSASGRDSLSLELQDVTYIITQREQFFLAVMEVKLAPNFSSVFFDFNSSLLKAIAFIINRLIYSIPVIETESADANSRLKKLAKFLRECLFNCDIAGAFLHYREMLHVIDGVLLGDSRAIRVNSTSTPAEVAILLQHFLDREKAVGLVQTKKQPKE
jgi:hypothetical protein